MGMATNFQNSALKFTEINEKPGIGLEHFNPML